MSQTVRLLVAMSLVSVASGATVASLNASITDAAGNTQTSTPIPVSSFPTPDASGNFQVEIDFTGVAPGSFSGTVSALSAAGDVVGTAVTFSGTATNLQPTPVSVTVAFS